MRANAFIRPCFEQDLEMVWLLAAFHAQSGFAILEERPLTLAIWQERWVRIVTRELPFLVACTEDNPSRVIGFAYADAPLLGASQLGGAAIELFLAVTPALHRHGLGGQLLSQLLDDLRLLGPHNVFACFGKPPGTSEPSPADALLRQGGFGHCATLPGAARKFGRNLDVVIMTRRL
jgi:L-amino acid N-acyltransferase YncA